MTQTLGTDSKNDLYLGDGKNLVMLSGIQAVLAACESATKAQLGEMVLAEESGVPNFQTIWIGSPNYKLYASYLRRVLLSVSGVEEVISLELRVSNNILSYTAEIKTSFGLGTVNG